MINKNSYEMHEIGMDFYNQGRYSEAVQALNKVQEDCPFYQGAQLHLGAAFLKQKNYHLALVVLDNIQPDDYSDQLHIQFLKGSALHELYKYPEAIEAWKKISEDSPFYYEAQFSQGIALCMLGEYYKAVEIWQKIPIDNSLYQESQFYIGVALFEHGEYEQAIKAFCHVQGDHPLYEEIKPFYDRYIAYFEKALRDNGVEEQIYDTTDSEAELIGDMV